MLRSTGHPGGYRVVLVMTGPSSSFLEAGLFRVEDDGVMPLVPGLVVGVVRSKSRGLREEKEEEEVFFSDLIGRPFTLWTWSKISVMYRAEQ